MRHSHILHRYKKRRKEGLQLLLCFASFCLACVGAIILGRVVPPKNGEVITVTIARDSTIQSMPATDQQQQQQQQRRRRRRRRLSSQQERNSDEEVERPIMYTYYEPAKTDMTEDADEILLKNWKLAWWNAGWQPRILTEDDAKQLPDYEELVNLVLNQKHIGSYNMACYIRWIAMAAVGGGFMSDYDTFPLNHFLRHGRVLPFDGQLTVYAGHVPALVSGSGDEYYRIAKRIGLNMQKHVLQQQKINEEGPAEDYRQHLPWSDMMALAELYHKVSSDMFIMRREVLNGVDALQRVEWRKADCPLSEGMRAVHFSHKAVSEGNQAYRGAIHRGTIARQFLNMWHRVCEYTAVKDESLADEDARKVSLFQFDEAVEQNRPGRDGTSASKNPPTPPPSSSLAAAKLSLGKQGAAAAVAANGVGNDHDAQTAIKKKRKRKSTGYIRLPYFSKEIDQPAEWFQI